ncbi:MAG: PAS domain-containing sensor histidine kinase [Syntrophobacteraceae bacterium]|nr:PAS domain-containing sensor histidine kinase [Syntrophobacteraceae bacterium]
MKKHSDDPVSRDYRSPLRNQLIGLGETSIRKSYYPELQKRLAELQKFRVLLDQSNDAIFVMEVPSGRLMDVNESACQQMDYSRQELLDLTIYDLTAPSPSEQIETFFSTVQARADVRETITTTLRGREGAEIPEEITLSSASSCGEVYAIAVARNITKRKQAEDALRKANDELEQKVRERTAELTEAYEQLERAYQDTKANQDKILQLERRAVATRVTSALAHETRNPIQVIGGFTRILKRKCAEDPGLANQFDIILKETERLEHLVGAILKAAREVATDFEQMDPQGLVDALVEATREKARLAKVLITKKTSPLSARVTADRECLVMALKEIIMNAIEVSPKEGEILLEVGQEGHWVVFAVSDSGEGIKEEQRDKIYGPFFSTKRLSSGLGLSFAKAIIETHHGAISFETREGKGTKFYVRLPATE